MEQLTPQEPGWFSSDGFMPHGHCYLWDPGVLWTSVISDSIIVLSYFSIPFALLYFIGKRPDIKFNWIFQLFSVFILACGVTHLLDVWTVWHTDYQLAAFAKAVTAAASLFTAILLWKLMPSALRIPSTVMLEEANARLQEEVKQRETSVAAMRKAMVEAVNAAPGLLFEVGLDGNLYDFHAPNITPEAAPHDIAKLCVAALHQANNQGYANGEYQLDTPQGKLWFEFTISRQPVAPGQEARFIVLSRDVTQRKQADRAMSDALATLDATEDADFIFDPVSLRFIYVNQGAVKQLGYSREELLTMTPVDIKPEYDEQDFRQILKPMLSGERNTVHFETVHRRKDGRDVPVEITLQYIKTQDESARFIAVARDITERKKSEKEIRDLAFYDPLTGLANRRLLIDHLQIALSASARKKFFGAVLFIDMDKFKALNDTLGHDYGDLLLIEVALRIKSCVREIDTVARLGGDEFVVVLEEIDEQLEIATHKLALIAEKIRVALAEPYRLRDNLQHSSPSIGVCLYHGTEQPVDVLLKCADIAMYQAKDAGRNTVRFFDPAMQQAVENHAALESDLRHAVPEQQLQLHYQIQMDSELRPLGAEALIRWIHPVRGMVSPMQFIPIAEESGLILEIGNWVLDTACRQLHVWAKQELTANLLIAVNVSAQQFKQPDFVEAIAKTLRTHAIDPSRLKLELTESVVLNDVRDVVTKMHALNTLGVRLSMDDFGTGYSSLSYLKQLPLDQIKIDMSFVRDMISDPNDAVMVRTIIDMAKNFRLNVIAEGVETEAQVNMLKQMGCMAYQGYYFSKPVPIEQFEALLGKC